MKQKNNLKKIAAFLTLLPIMFLFTNGAWFSQNRQEFRIKAFGPSPISIDGRSIFNSHRGLVVKRAYWDRIRRNVNTIFIHSLFLDQAGQFQRNNASDIALNKNQLLGLRDLQRSYDFKVVVGTSLSLGRGCDERNLKRFAENAVERDRVLFRNLLSAGIKIYAISVDGPFLRVIQRSQKAFSCATASVKGGFQDKGFPIRQSVEIVGRYLTKIQSLVQIKQGFKPKVNLVINLPNWKVGNVLGRENIDLLNVIASFKRTPYYPAVNEVVLDYPYSYIRKNPRKFQAKIKKLSRSISGLRGSPKLSFIVNTEIGPESFRHEFPKGHTCLQAGNVIPKLLLYKNNKCFKRQVYGGDREYLRQARNLIKKADRSYVLETLKYYNLVKYGLPRGIDVSSVYMQSWQKSPSEMSVYGLKMANILSR